jgi:hypothetical protein
MAVDVVLRLTYKHLLSEVLHLALFHFLGIHLVLHSDSLSLLGAKASGHQLFGLINKLFLSHSLLHTYTIQES